MALITPIHISHHIEAIKKGQNAPSFFLKCVSLLDDFDLIANCVRSTQQIIKIAEIGEDTI